MTRGTSKKGPQKKKTESRLTHCGPGPRCSLTSFPGRLFRLVFFFCCGQARTLTHSLRSWAAMPPAGVVFFFCCGPARTGVVFFFLLWPRPDAHSLTVGWGDFGKALVFLFLLRPRRTRRANNKKCRVYYIGSKKTPPGGATAKKNTTSAQRVLHALVVKHFQPTVSPEARVAHNECAQTKNRKPCFGGALKP